MKICPSCGKPLDFWDRLLGWTKHDACASRDEDRARESARQDELAKAKAEEEERNRELMAQRRTKGLSRIVGQQDAIQRLRNFTALYANGRPGHVLLTGPDGVGKRTVARAFACECCPKEVEIDAKDLGRHSDLFGPLTNLGSGDGLIIANLQQLNRPIAELLASAMRNFAVDFVVDKDGTEKTLRIPLDRFVCIATATSEQGCQRGVLEAFPLVLPISVYSLEKLIEICQRLAEQNKISFTPPSAALIARTCDGTPHQIELLVKRLAALGKPAMEENEVAEALSTLGFSTKSVTSANGPASFDTLSGVDFEKMIASLLRRMSFEAVMTKASGDGGIDIVATLDRPVVGGRYLIQCKRFAAGNLVGAALVREFYGAVTADRRAVKGILITTSDFTSQAKEFARRVPIELIGGTQLNKLLSEHGLLAADPPGFRLFS